MEAAPVPKKFRKKKKLGSYPSATVVFSFTVSLLVLGVFGLLLVHATQLTTVIKQNVEVHVYLRKSATENDRIRIGKIIGEKDYIANKDDSPLVAFKSKEEAAEEFIAATGEDFYDFLGENPLRDAFILRIKEDYFTPENLAQIKADLEALSGVFEVVYLEDLVGNINRNVTTISLVLLVLAGLLVIFDFVLISNTIKLALFSQRFIIRSMQLVGATGRFVRTPFLLRSALHGTLSGLLACALLYGLMHLAYERIPDLQLVANLPYTLALFGLLVLMGAGLALFTTNRAVRKYLRLSLDELY